jgi:hypothetical protein
MITIKQWERLNMILENPRREGVSTIILQLDEHNRWHISTHQIMELFEIDSIEKKYIVVKEKVDDQAN